jgi:hypothetical protein
MEDGLGGHLEKRHLQVDTPTSRISAFFVFNCLAITVLFIAYKRRRVKASKEFEKYLPGMYRNTRVENLLCQAGNQQVRYQIFTVRYGTR